MIVELQRGVAALERVSDVRHRAAGRQAPSSTEALTAEPRLGSPNSVRDAAIRGVERDDDEGEQRRSATPARRCRRRSRMSAVVSSARVHRCATREPGGRTTRRATGVLSRVERRQATSSSAHAPMRASPRRPGYSAAVDVMTAIGSPAGDRGALRDRELLDVPALWAVISFSIFIASMTQISAPSSTSRPARPAPSSTLPWSGESERRRRRPRRRLLALAPRAARRRGRPARRGAAAGAAARR